MSGNQPKDKQFNTVEEAIEDIKNGKIVIVVDDENRENEGDFIVAAEHVTPEIVNFMSTHGRGLMCVALTAERCRQLDLDLMVSNSNALKETAFTVSVDLIHPEITTGISVNDRYLTIKSLIDPSTKPGDLARPGHLFPLIAKENGVLRRAGHTEATIDLTRMAGLTPGGVLVEIMNEDGSMARLKELKIIAQRFGIKIISVEDLIKYRLKRETLIKRGVTAKLPTKFGDFQIIPFIQMSNNLEHIALVKGEWTKDDPILVRVHSSCATGDIFGSYRCDCGAQLHQAMRLIEKEGRGAIVYLIQEGRGIGLFNKVMAYKLQEEGKDTVEANIELGFKPDERDYGVGAGILRELGLGKIRLMTNNPVKRAALEAYGLQIVENVPLEVEPNPYNEFYMQTKKDKMGHFLELVHPKH
ncbi:MAG TPA: bifunctional 3,4-dihydroxy-2-butanone-4-phosphate synthase/GTP cyclohydrolase II [Bacteroidales bacterium]|nr:bifunctional 3,4-dihydroxy-2-butanone-4-phosphate synthase/GTP cyclohydrolase II [Bacteroidales bacterium]